MTTMLTPGGYSEGDVLRWLDQAKELLEQTLERIATSTGRLNSTDRQAVTDNLVLIANVVTHLSRQGLHPDVSTMDPVTAEDPPDLIEHPGVLARLHDIHDRVQDVYKRLQAGISPLN